MTGNFWKSKQSRAFALASAALVMTGVGLAWTLTHFRQEQRDLQTKTSALASVEVEEVLRKDMRKSFQLFTALQPWKEALVRPMTVGFVQEVNVHVGDRVSKDDILFRLNSEAQKLKAELDGIDYELKQLDYKVAMALASKNFLSKQEVRQRELENRATKVRARLAEIDNQGLARAPFDGVVSEIGFKVGDYLDSSNQNANLRIVDLSTMKISFWIPQSVANKITTKTEIRLQMEDQFAEAELLAISPTVDQKTGSVFVEAKVNQTPLSWRAGQFVQAHLTLEKTEGAIIIPKTALHTEQDQSFVWKITKVDASSTENRGPAAAQTEERTLVTRVPIQTGATEGDWIEVKSGLEEFDQVVTRGGSSGLSDGSQVEISYDR